MPKDEWPKLGILYDPTAKYSPSNELAIHRFCMSAIKHNLLPVLLSENDNINERDYVGLLIRDTTHPAHYTYGWSVLATAIGIKVIDPPLAIQQGCNKIWQAQLFLNNHISHPKTCLVRWDNSHIDDIEYPCVVKIPDSCFSQGVYRCNSKVELADTLYNLWFEGGQKGRDLICQEFIETKYDWRITIFNNQFLFAVKYYMADKDWKIIKYDRKGNYIEGNHECVKFEDIPLHVLAEAEKCNKLLKEGLYGIDIKEVDGKAYVIEINDNPSIDGDVEDELEGERIYDTIVGCFRS